MRGYTSWLIGMAVLGTLGATSASAQWTGGRDRTGGNGVTVREAIGASILSDMAADRQAERDARRQPYAGAPTPSSSGWINSVADAKQGCNAEASAEVSGRMGGAARVSMSRATNMATGWEVEGEVERLEGNQVVERVPFVCSVREGAVTGVLLRDTE